MYLIFLYNFVYVSKSNAMRNCGDINNLQKIIISKEPGTMLTHETHIIPVILLFMPLILNQDFIIAKREEIC